MSHKLSQPEEVDLAMMEMEDMNWRAGTSAAGKNIAAWTAPTIPTYGYVSPYRAAHIRAMQYQSNPQT